MHRERSVSESRVAYRVQYAYDRLADGIPKWCTPLDFPPELTMEAAEKILPQVAKDVGGFALRIVKITSEPVREYAVTWDGGNPTIGPAKQ
jgi:hypothetical protein